MIQFDYYIGAICLSMQHDTNIPLQSANHYIRGRETGILKIIGNLEFVIFDNAS